MKTRIMILLLSLLLILPFATTASALAGFETEAVSDKVKQQAIANTNMQLITEPGHVSSIACFDISETGLVGIGVDVPGTKQIHVMDLNGNPLYGYSFDSAGSFGFSFEGENVAIYFNRSDIIEVYDSEGQCVDVRKAVTSSSNYTECVQEILDATEKQIGGTYFGLSVT